MKLVVTGAQGFLGWHTRVRLRALTDHEVVPVSRREWARLPELVAGADAVIHLAGANRGPDSTLEQGNVELAQELVRAVEESVQAGAPAPRILYANTIHSSSDTPYGRGKSAAAQLLARRCHAWDSIFTDIVFPNIFGENARPRYNSFVATFVEAVIAGSAPESIEDREIELLHAQEGAAVILSALAEPVPTIRPTGTPTTVSHILSTLQTQYKSYHGARLPDLTLPIDVDLFNTMRARLFPKAMPHALTENVDARGRLIEAVRSPGGPGQVFVSTTSPGSTRGEHYHLRKIERFSVISGRARISLRKVCGRSRVISFDVSGETPVVIDMPTMWVHNITNTGPSELITMFWTNELFDPAAPDTFWEPVLPPYDINEVG